MCAGGNKIEAYKRESKKYINRVTANEKCKLNLNENHG